MKQADTGQREPCCRNPSRPMTPKPASASDIHVSLISGKIKDWHLQRKAIVYVRQSTAQQVLEHRESADRQYGLVERAVLLGWSRDRVEVVDEDLAARRGEGVVALADKIDVDLADHEDAFLAVSRRHGRGCRSVRRPGG